MNFLKMLKAAFGFNPEWFTFYAGGGGSQPSSTTQTTTTIPEYAKPYVERMLGKAEATTERPYQTYGGQRVAEFTPLQQQAFQGASELGPTQQVAQGSQYAGIAGIQGLGAGQRYASQATSPYATAAYMSPFTEMALAPQLREARRQSDITGQQMAGQAVQAGAFGGSRFGIMEAERQRNLAQQQADIYGKGMQTAFEQARQAQQFGADLGLRGSGLGLQAAGTLGQLGQTQFGQQQGAIQAQAAAGAQQQQLDQQKLSTAYQDFLSQRGYDQQQLAFMSDILRGVPLSQSTQQTYQAPPSLASQAMQLGLGAYGMSKSGFFKEGGEVKGYAEGGIASAVPQGSVPNTMSIDKLRSALGDMSDEQLDAVAAKAGDDSTLALFQEQKSLNARIRNAGILSRSIPETTIKEEMLGGLDNAPVPESLFATGVGEQEEQPEEMASGGIVAFAKGKEVKAPAEPKPDFVQQLSAFDPSKALISDEERTAATETGLKRYQEYMGADETKPLMEEILKTYKEAYSPEAREQQKGMIALKAASKFGRRGKAFTEELGEAASGVADDVREAQKLEREAKRQMALAQLDYAKAQRAEKRGNWEMAEKYGDKAEARKEKAAGAEERKLEKLAGIQMQQEQLKQQKEIGLAQIAATRAGQTDFNRQVLQNKIDESIAMFTTQNGRAPNPQELAQIRGAASEAAAKLLKVDPYGAGKLNVQAENAVSARLGKDSVYKDLALQLLTADAKDKPTIQAKMDAREAQIRADVQSIAGGEAAPAPKAKPSLQQFLERARQANPGVSDAELTAYYNKTYGN